MNNNNALHSTWLIFALSVLICGSIMGADLANSETEIHLESAGTQVDAITKQINLPMVRIWQAGYEIQAELGQAKGLNFDNSQWSFSGKVHITTPQGRLTADRATVTFQQHRITELHINGQPATFEQLSATNQTLVQGRAESIDYLVQGNNIRLSNKAWVKYGQNEFSGRTVVYDLTHQRVLANPEEQQGEKVHIIITPNSSFGQENSSSSGIKSP